jgi:hypothetical protein
MATETEVKPLTTEDVVKIVEETLSKRERRSTHERELKAEAIDVDALAKKIGESVEAALDRHAAKQAETHAKDEKAKAEKAEAEKKTAEEKQKSVWGW